jgi:hypothetical protein
MNVNSANRADRNMFLLNEMTPGRLSQHKPVQQLYISNPDWYGELYHHRIFVTTGYFSATSTQFQFI